MNEPEGGILYSLWKYDYQRTALTVYNIMWFGCVNTRRKTLKPGVREYLKKVLYGLLRSIPGVEIETIGFDGDHVHMVMIIPPKYAISDVMGQLKSQSSSRMRKKVDWLAKVYWKENIM